MTSHRESAVANTREAFGDEFANWLDRTLAEQESKRPKSQAEAIAMRREVEDLIAERTHLRQSGRLYTDEYRNLDAEIRRRESLIRESGFRAEGSI